MSKKEAIKILRSASEDADLSDQEEELFEAIYDRKPDRQDRKDGLISLCYAGI